MASNFDDLLAWCSRRLGGLETMAGRDELTDKAWEKKREVSVNLTAAPAHQHAVSARHRPSKASAKSGSSTRTTRPSDAAEGESSEASSSTRQDAVPGPEGLALSASFGGPEGMALLAMERYGAWMTG